jgi:hypothetical protein
MMNSQGDAVELMIDGIAFFFEVIDMFESEPYSKFWLLPVRCRGPNSESDILRLYSDYTYILVDAQGTVEKIEDSQD